MTTVVTDHPDKKRRGRKAVIVMSIILLVGLAFAIAFGGDNKGVPASANGNPSPPASADENIDEATGLPIVEGGDPNHPISGSESDQDSRTPVVRDGGTVSSWTELDALLGDDLSYTQCVERTTSVDWQENIPKYKVEEAKGIDARYILAVNVAKSVSDDEIRRIESEEADEDLSNLSILRVDEIVNTRGLKEGGCQEFLDRRSMVRVTLGSIVWDPDGSIKGVLKGEGVFDGCHNAWRLPTPKPSQAAPSPAPTKPGEHVPPVPPEKPKPTPTPTTVCPPDMPHGTPPNCKDDPVNDVNVNPAVPPQVRGPGTTPVGTDPGPATPPVDSPTGCDGPCPAPAPAPAPAPQPSTPPSEPAPVPTPWEPPEATPVPTDPPAEGELPEPPPSGW